MKRIPWLGVPKQREGKGRGDADKADLSSIAKTGQKRFPADSI
jgi:hypothetical protein